MAEHQVLFCPFCRESFEGRASCPEHELALVSFDKLAPDPELDDDVDELPGAAEAASHLAPASAASPVIAPDDRPVALLEPRYGRAAVALGAVLNLAAFGCELVQVHGFPTASVYQLARHVPTLWAVPLVSFTVGFVLLRRRTPRQLRGLRVLVPLLALVSPTNLLWTYAMLDGFERSRSSTSLGAAAYATAAASLLLLIAGSRLGSSSLKPRA